MSDHFINRYRYNVYIWWTCVILQLWIITWPILWLMTRRWEVLSARWTCVVKHGDLQRGWVDDEADDPGWLVVHDVASRGVERWPGESEEQFRQRIAGITEGEWLEMAIIAAAEERKQQRLTYADLLAARTVSERISQRRRERASEASQGGFAGAATGLLRGVSDVLRDAEMA